MMSRPDDSTGGGIGLTRRGLLGSAAATGLAATLVSPARGNAATSTASTASEIEVFADPTINLQVLFALGGASYGASELGEVFTAIDAIRAAGSTNRAVFDVFLDLGRRVRGVADQAVRQGHRATARDCYLRAAMYLDQALFFTLASGQPTRTHEGQVYAEMEHCFGAAACRFSPAFERVSIPYANRSLPGWLLVPPGSRIRRPTVILNNGSDGQNIDSFVYGGRAALERGWNALIFEGPGQGSNLFLHNIVFPPAWERVITAVVSWLRARPEVDRRRIALSSQSFGGYLVARAAAFEHRLAAVIADPGVHDVFATWSTGKNALPPVMVNLLREGREQEFNAFWREALPTLPAAERFVIAKRSEIYSNGSFYERMRNAMKFTLSRSLAQRITAPIALTSPDQETFFPGQAQTLYGWLRARPRTLIHFTAAQGAQLHCEPMAPTTRNDTIFDWLEGNLRPTG